MKSRFTEIDMAKGIAMLAVVGWHTQMPDEIKNVVSVFMVPLFFLVSGYLFNIDKYATDFKSFVKARAWALLMPYTSACTLFYSVWLATNYLGTRDEGFIWYKGILGALYGNGENLIISVPLWFLVSMFCSQIIFYLMLRGLRTYRVSIQLGGFILTGVIGVYTGQFIHLPWGFDIALAAQPFLFTGFLIKQYKVTLKPISLLSLSSLILFSAAVYFNSPIDINLRVYNNVILYILGGVSGSLLILQVMKYASAFNFVVKPLSLIGRHTLPILIFHTGLVFRAVGIADRYVTVDDFHWFIYWFLGVSACVIVGVAIERIKILNLLFNGKRSINRIKPQTIPHTKAS